ncbi:MAG: HyaD/HybD family hydrogenase maturation endopeptidase [Deltaproteobacteria bacterium]|nr:HyaD/HybD family hydrogenase maturation endopeptidase [Deltaproteobacteria bacterium]
MNIVKSISSPKITVIGVGNLLLRDEGVGVRTVEYIIENHLLPADIEVIDGGTGGMKIVSLIQNTDYLIIIDAVNGRGMAGDICRLTINDISPMVKQKRTLHGIGMQEVFSLLQLMGGKMPETIVIGVAPMDISYGDKLSPKIKRAVPKIAAKVIKEVKNIQERCL